MNRPNLFNSINSYNNEIDLRKEFDILIYGNQNSIPHGHWAILRKMRRNEDNSLVACVCHKAASTHEADPDCSYCLGEGYLWDESWQKIYKMTIGPDGGQAKKYVHMPNGFERTEYLVFYLRYDCGIQYEDKIIEVFLDAEGRPFSPLKRKNIFRLETIVEYRSDNGRIEYIGAFCREFDAWRADS